VASDVGSVATDAQSASEEELDALEVDADQRYGAVVPLDTVLVEAFEAKAAEVPDEFAPAG
jgi:hypothetical protein